MADNGFDKIIRLRVLGKSPVGAFLRANQWVWNRIADRMVRSNVMRAYGRLLNALVRRYADRTQYFGTFFLRNRPQLELIVRLVDQMSESRPRKLAVLGCSNGAEVYSILATLRKSRPALSVVLNAVDISAEVLALAEKGAYSVAAPELVGEAIFQRLTTSEIQAMFERIADFAIIRPWIKAGISWHLGDVRDPAVLNRLGLHDLVVANNFLCHMKPVQAEECLVGLARLVKPGGFLIVSGVDLDVRKKVAEDHEWQPISDFLEEIHDGDIALRKDWPFNYWGLEPIDKNRDDWVFRYATAFRIGRLEASNNETADLEQYANK
jgi:chemotaxis methyl-accepting protein methylase